MTGAGTARAARVAGGEPGCWRERWRLRRHEAGADREGRHGIRRKCGALIWALETGLETTQSLALYSDIGRHPTTILDGKSIN